MKKIILLACCCLAILVASGCGGSQADELAQEQIKLINELADAHENGAPESQRSEIFSRMKKLSDETREANISDSERKRVAEKYKDEFVAAQLRMAKVMKDHQKINPYHKHSPIGQGLMKTKKE